MLVIKKKNWSTLRKMVSVVSQRLLIECYKICMKWQAYRNDHIKVVISAYFVYTCRLYIYVHTRARTYNTSTHTHIHTYITELHFLFRWPPRPCLILWLSKHAKTECFGCLRFWPHYSRSTACSRLTRGTNHHYT